MEVICLQEEAFYELIETVVARLKDDSGNAVVKEWVSKEEAQELLGIGKTTLARYRNDGLVKYTQQGRNLIMYSRSSIEEYLERNAKTTF